MNNKVAIIICSYNMPEYTDALCEHITDTVSSFPYDLVVVDNGSNIVSPSKYTTHRIEENIQMIPGFMWGLDQLKEEYFAYWLLTTSCRFDPENRDDPLSKLVPVLVDEEKAYAVQPSLLHPNGGAWEKLLSPREPHELRRVWATDYVCTLFKAKYFDQLGRWRKELARGWGVGMENFYFARKAGYYIYTQDDYVMVHDTGIGYDMNRMSETYKERQTRAVHEIDKIFIPLYGKNYREVMNWSYRETGKGEY